MRNRLYNDRVTIIGPDGTERGRIRAVVNKERIITQDASVLVETGDTIERDLPHGRKETLTAADVQFHRGIGRGRIPDYYEITTERPDSQIQPPLRTDVSVYVSDSPHARVNLQSVDNSSNVVSIQAHDVFQQTRHLIETSVVEDAERVLLLESVNDMEAAHNRGDLIGPYKHFMGLAADHVSVLAPVISTLASLL